MFSPSKSIKKWDLKQWISAKKAWDSVQRHIIFTCECENKEVVKCWCGQVLCEKLKHHYSKNQGCCFNCDTWCQPSPFNPKNKKLLGLCESKCDNCDEILIIKEITLDDDIIGVDDILHKCSKCKNCHSYLCGYYCEECRECHDGSYDEDLYMHCPKCDECRSIDHHGEWKRCVECLYEFDSDTD